MMDTADLYAKPRVVVSRCLGFAACRCNGVTIPDDFVAQLAPSVDYLTVCSELEIDLGVPRQPIRIVSVAGVDRLLQPATGTDVTAGMNRFAAAYFARAVLQRFPGLAIEDQGRLLNARIREHFLATLFALARFRRVVDSDSLKELVRYQAEHKLLLMTYCQVQGFFLELLERYRSGKILLSAVNQVLRAWIARFGEPYLASQVFFAPYPGALAEVGLVPDACHEEKDYWKHNEGPAPSQATS